MRWYISGFEAQTNLLYGLSSLMIGTLLLCFGYLFIKKSMTEENEAITIMVPSIAIIVYGLFERIGGVSTPIFAWTPALLCVGILSGAGMFAAYIATMKLYALTDLVSAEFPTLLSSIVIQPVEMFFLGEPLRATYVFSSVGFVLMIYFILKWQNFENAKSKEPDCKSLHPLALPMVAQTLDYTCGAACFESMYKYFKASSPGEMHFAKELGSLDLGYTPPNNVVELARRYGFVCEMKAGAQISDLVPSLLNNEVVFVTWWDEDAGHYSLVKALEKDYIILMDPWSARQGLDNRVKIKDFIPNWNTRGGKMISVSLPK